MKNFFNQNLSPTALLTLLAIKIHETDGSFEASQSQLGELIGVERKTVLAALKELRDRNLISITRQEPHQPFVYSVTLSKKRTGSGETNAVLSNARTTLRPVEQAAPEEFTAFWELYPRRVAKAAAKKAFKAALRKAGAADILSATRLFAEAMAGKEKAFIPYPATWLNQERWNDELDEVVGTTDRQHSRRAAIFAALAGNGDLAGTENPDDENRSTADTRPAFRVISARDR